MSLIRGVLFREVPLYRYTVINECRNVHIDVRFSTCLHVGIKNVRTKVTCIHVGIKKVHSAMFCTCRDVHKLYQHVVDTQVTCRYGQALWLASHEGHGIV